ncbi:MAG: hypothetical protein V2A79_12980, partial [Planctomycetota bacterium]
AEGWERFHDGQYREAVECFAAAEVANPADPQAAIGTVFAAVADRSGALADSVLERLLARGTGVFAMELDVRTKLADPELITQRVANVSRMARQNLDAVSLQAMSAFLLWFTGQHDEALRVADRIHEKDRTSAYAPLAAQMRGESPPPQSDGVTNNLNGLTPLASQRGKDGL